MHKRANLTGGIMAAGEKARASSARAWIFMYAGILAVMLIIEGPLRSINHGGLFSMVHAVGAAGSRTPRVDVDEMSLLFPLVCLTGLIGCVAGWALRVNMDTRVGGLFIALVIMGGAFVLDIAFGGKAIDRYMASHGYTYCTADNYSTGHGKGTAYFRVYALDPAGCPAPGEQ